MSPSLLNLITERFGGRRAIERVEPRWTFADVVLPLATRRSLDQALAEVRSQNLIFGRWGLGERHSSGLSIAINFAGPPGTGKTICAEAIAHALNKELLLVRYAELESMWMGETPKNVAAVFRAAADNDAVLFFDEADAIAARRGTGVGVSHMRESNTVVNVLLRELEHFNGVVIFATNLAANFDPAFERRIRTHVLFEMPGPLERERIWRAQIHPTKTPLAKDVDFHALSEAYDVSGGDIKNAVLKAAAAASIEPASDDVKQIHQRHFEQGIQDVLAAKKVMTQTILPPDLSDPASRLEQMMENGEGRWKTMTLAALALAGLALAIALAAVVVAIGR
jgi:SpoVK/Ycf46/Vps4 family AAA+-type ATPase